MNALIHSVESWTPARVMLAGIRQHMHMVRYAAFAIVAILMNVLSQNAVLLVLGGFWFGIYIAIAFGNASGLFFKFVADKYWVFEDTDASLLKTSGKFALYAMFGMLTTLIFWGVELLFHYLFQTTLMTNVGAVLGLSVGYVIKYNLDKTFTFVDRPGVSARA